MRTPGAAYELSQLGVEDTVPGVEEKRVLHTEAEQHVITGQLQESNTEILCSHLTAENFRNTGLCANCNKHFAQ